MTGVVVLTVFGLLLVVLALVTARRPATDIPDRNGYFDRWAELHGGYDPRTGSRWLRGWLTMVHAVARPLALRGVHPDLLTTSALWVGVAVVVAAEPEGRWPLLAAWVLVVSGLLDNLDGAVAVLQQRTTRWGYVLDSAVDRLSDVLYLLAVVAIGGRADVAAACGFLFFFLEYVRARAGNAGGDEVGRITVAERPTRVIVLALTLFAGGLLVEQQAEIATAGLAVMTALTAVGLAQLMPTVRRQLLTLP